MASDTVKHHGGTRVHNEPATLDGDLPIIQIIEWLVGFVRSKLSAPVVDQAHSLSFKTANGWTGALKTSTTLRETLPMGSVFPVFSLRQEKHHVAKIPFGFPSTDPPIQWERFVFFCLAENRQSEHFTIAV